MYVDLIRFVVAGQFRVPGHGHHGVPRDRQHADLAGRRDDADDLDHVAALAPGGGLAPEVGLLLRTQAGTGVRPDEEHIEGLAGRRRPQMLHRDLGHLVEAVLDIGVAGAHRHQGQRHHDDPGQQHPVEPRPLGLLPGPPRPPARPALPTGARSRSALVVVVAAPAAAPAPVAAALAALRSFRRNGVPGPAESPPSPAPAESPASRAGPRSAGPAAGRTVGAAPPAVSTSHSWRR